MALLSGTLIKVDTYEFKNNEATYGGAVTADQATSMKFTSCNFTRNTADAGPAAPGMGGAVECNSCKSVTIYK